MNATLQAQEEREKREAAAAFDLLEHPAWADLLRDVAREAKGARGALFNDPDKDNVLRARGALAVLRNIVLAVYRRANQQLPPHVAALFE